VDGVHRHQQRGSRGGSNVPAYFIRY
jgi:hypothetical protein